MDIIERKYLNHEDTNLGTPCIDGRKRLSVWKCKGRRNQIVYSWKCYNCGDHGHTHFRPVKYNQANKIRNVLPVEGEALTDQCKAWPYKYGITDAEIAAYRIEYDRKHHAIILPVYDDQGLKAQQMRKLDGMPKYLTSICAKRGGKPLFYGKKSGNILCLTEDILSAIKVSRLATPNLSHKNLNSVNGVALLGTSLTSEQAVKLARLNPSEAFIFLDNDNYVVKKQQRKIKKLLDTYLDCPVHIVRQGKDPKELSMQELEAILL